MKQHHHEDRKRRTCEHCGVYKQRHPASCRNSRERQWFNGLIVELTQHLETKHAHSSPQTRDDIALGWLAGYVGSDTREAFFQALSGSPRKQAAE